MRNKPRLLRAGIAFAAISTFTALSMRADQDPQPVTEIYIHGMVWNTQAPVPANDWLVRLDLRAVLPNGNQPSLPNPGFATLGDDLHDLLGSDVTLSSAALQGTQLTITGTITESKTPALIGLPVRIEGFAAGTAVRGLTVTTGNNAFTGAGMFDIGNIIESMRKRVLPD